MTEIASPHRTPNRRMRRRLLRAFAGNRRGMAAVEFALVVPLLLTMYLGLIELTQALGHDRKSVLLARTLADVVSQSAGISNSDMTAIFNASASTMAPYSTNKLTMRVTSFTIDGAANAYVDWSDAKDLGADNAYTPYGRCRVSNDLIPLSIRSPRSWIVLSEVKIQHIPLFGTFIAPNGIEMVESLPMRPRVSNSIVRQGSPTSACPGSIP
ncbi:MAG: pilus assembly protein [Proteobacteria bacterium]|nr:pilus assembly protein [Pseudomonadota bacterium]